MIASPPRSETCQRMDYIFPPPAPISLPVNGCTGRFPLHRIFCVGRNYAEHAREMGVDPRGEPPCFFSKPANALSAGSSELAYPPATNDLHHEIELVVALHRGGRDIPAARALDCVYGYAAGIDLTRRDLQAEAKQRRWPWDTAKSFEASAPCSAISPASATGHPEHARLWLAVNGEIRQDSNIAEMTFSVAELIAQLSTLFELSPGDLIFTGTPAGVSALQRGDHVTGGVDGIGTIDLKVI